MNQQRFAISLYLVLLYLSGLLVGCQSGEEATAVTIITRIVPVTATPAPQPPATPTPTDWPDTLAVTLDETISPDSFSPEAPLIFHFNQPMNGRSVGMPVIISPSVRGDFTWSHDDTTLTFTPDNPLRGEQIYRLTIHNSLKSTSGLMFPTPQRWHITTVQVTHIVTRTPATQTISDKQPEIVLRFNRPMDMLGVSHALSMTPTLPYLVTWDNDSTLRLTLQAEMEFATIYHFSLAKTAVSQDGLHLTSNYTWSYQLNKTLLTVSGPTATNHLAPLTFTFNYPIDQASFNESLRIEPAIAGEIIWNSSQTTAVLTPHSQLPAQTSYLIHFTAPLHTPDGQTLPTPDPLTLTTPHSILSHQPHGTNADPGQLIEIRFDRPMDQASVTASFLITPTLAGSLEWQANTLRFLPTTGYLAENQEYTVTLRPPLVGSDGEQIINQPYTWTFHTRQMADVANFGYGPNVQVLDANGRRAIQFPVMGRESHRVQFELYRLDLSQFLTQYATGFNPDNNGYNAWQLLIDETGAELAASWEMETAVAAGEWGNVQELLIPADVPPGLYILNLNARYINDQLFLALTTNTLMVKQAGEQLLVWATDINDQPLPGVAITVYASDGRTLTSGSTNAQGLLRTTIPPSPTDTSADETPLLVVGQSGNNLTISGLTYQWRAYGSSYWWENNSTQPGQASAAYIITDRPIYKPGQTVSFKAILRQDEDAQLSLPVAGTAVTLLIRDSRDNLVQTFDLTTNDYGTVNGTFTLAEGAMLGAYHIELLHNGITHRQTFKVEDYRKPDYQVSVTTDQDAYILGDQITVTVDTTYFFGKPVANAAVTVRRYDPYITWDDSYSGNQADAIQGHTDAHGRFTATLSINQNNTSFNSVDWRSSLGRDRWDIEATVDDGSHQTVSGFVSVAIYNALESFSISTNGYFHTPGEPFTVQATVKTIWDEVVNGRTLTLTLRRWDQNTNDYATVLERLTLTTGTDGTAAFPLTVNTAGYYELEVTGEDSAGHALQYTRWIYVYSHQVTEWYGRSRNGLNIIADKAEYQPGDTAHLLIESNFSGPALLTMERGSVRRTQSLTLNAPVTAVEVPIESGDIPNIYVTVNAWQAQDTSHYTNTSTSLADSTLRMTSINLSVPALASQLQVSITPDREIYAPGDTATFTVRVTNWAGVPVAAELSLALVDEAIFALSEELSGPIYDAFYFPRQNKVVTFHSLRPSRYFWEGGMGGGDGGAMAAAPRQDFPDTAAWFPVLYTDYNGEVVVSVTLPDSLTSWRLTAKATTADTQVGQAVANILTQQEIIVRPLLPRMLTVGDTAVLSAILHNYSLEPLTMAATLSVNQTLLTVATAPTQTLTVRPGETAVVGWPVTAISAGEATILVTAVPDNGRVRPDAIQLPLTIQPLSIPDVTSDIGEFRRDYVTTLNLPDNALEMSSVQVELSRSIAGNLLTGLEYLTGYPYGCVEQTMSKALPNAVIGRALHQLGMSNPQLEATLPAQIQASIQRLYGFQHNDGGWGWWFDDHSHDYQTAWVIFGLAQVTAAGYEVDAGVIARGATWLNDHLTEMDGRTRAFALYALAVAGQPNEAATLDLLAKADTLDAFSQAGLALALHSLGQDEAAREMVARLAETAVTENGWAYWPGTDHDGYYDAKTMASATRNTALALTAFTQIAPSHELEGDIVRWLMNQRRSLGWGTTNETSFAILGLTDHLLADGFQETAVATPYTIWLNGQIIAEGEFAPGNPSYTLSIPHSLLQRGDNTLEIHSPTNRLIYYTITHRIYLSQADIAAAGNITITRTYLSPETGERMTTFQPGQLVQVNLTLHMPQLGAYMIIEDQLPGGLEALHEGLNNTSHEATAYYYEEEFYRWQEYGYNYKEIHGHRVSFFVTEIGNGQHTFTYFARATLSGTFTAMPTEAYAMYNSALWGRSASQTIVIAQ